MIRIGVLAICIFGLAAQTDAQDIPSNLREAEARTARAVKALNERRIDYLYGLRQGRTSEIQGIFERTKRGAIVFVPAELPSEPIAVENSGSVPSAALQLPVRARVSSADPGNNSVHIMEGSIELEAVRALNTLTQQVPETLKMVLPRLQGGTTMLMASLRQLENAYMLRELKSDDFSETVQSVVEAYCRATLTNQPMSNDLRRQFVNAYKHAHRGQKQRERSEKAVFGRNDAYYPVVYRRMASASKGTAAISIGGQESNCSSFLLAKNQVLTARHCVPDSVVAQDVEVWFNFEYDPPSEPLSKDIFQVSSIVRGEKDNTTAGVELDFALLALMPKNEGGNTVDAGDRYPVQCVGIDRLPRERPLYVVGHPSKRARHIHDNAWVILPFEVPMTTSNFCASSYWHLRMDIELELVEAADRTTRLAEFVASYRPVQVSGTEAAYQLFDLTRAGNGQPTIGTDSDTFHGNSGGPTHDKATHLAVALFRGGQPDYGEYAAGWRRHEGSLPMKPIVEQLRRRMGDAWFKDQKICIYTKHTGHYSTRQLIDLGSDSGAVYRSECEMRCAWDK